MLGELNWIFTAITDTIAWNTLPRGKLILLLSNPTIFLILLFFRFIPEAVSPRFARGEPIPELFARGAYSEIV